MPEAAEPNKEERRNPGFWRVVGALVLSALLCSIAIGTIFTALKLVQDGQGMDGWTVGLVLYSSVALLFALPVALFLGGPLYYLLSHGRQAPLLPLVLSAGVLAVVPFMLIGSRSIPSEGAAGLVGLSVFLFAIGCLGGLVFWKIAGLKRAAIDREGQ